MSGPFDLRPATTIAAQHEALRQYTVQAHGHATSETLTEVDERAAIRANYLLKRAVVAEMIDPDPIARDQVRPLARCRCRRCREHYDGGLR